GGRVHTLVFDATGLRSARDLRSLYDFFHPLLPKVGGNGRVLVATSLPEKAEDPVAAASARAVEGFIRSVAKEIGKRGATANMAYVEKGAETRLAGVARFVLSARSAYVDGQPFRVTNAVTAPRQVAFTEPLKGKIALVTGGARGIGAATAKRLAEEGAHVVCADIPADAATLEETVKSINGTALPIDVTDPQAPRKLADFFKEKFSGVDIVIHNAGVTRDKTLARMDERFWDMVLAINLDAILRIDQLLLGEGIVRNEGHIVCLSSIGGIAGNLGQTNYGATKAGLIGYVKAQAPRLAGKGICINAVAPGFIETRMTAAIPFMIREAGRRMNSMSQGGQPQDVAELITFLSTPGASGI
ncbi:MAG: 3-oxoacyl-ACP reductase, partial [Nevskiales bacterium]